MSQSDPPTAEDTARWQRRLAAQANNRAWRLAEAATRSAAEDEEMMQAAHAAMHFWKIVGNEGNRAHAALLVAHVHALLGQADWASRYWAQAEAHFFATAVQDWEVAVAHAVAANVAAARQDQTAHRAHYRQAFERVAQLPDPEDREILEATLRVLPAPAAP